MPDQLTRAQRSYCMSQIKSKGTSLEVSLEKKIKKLGYRFKRNVNNLPGRPDFVFEEAKLIVFIDGDFWHGWRFPIWRGRLSAYWDSKIEKNRNRDKRNFSKLRRMGWKVIRVWEHSLKNDPDKEITNIQKALIEKCSKKCLQKMNI